jgi:hypothetical protein
MVTDVWLWLDTNSKPVGALASIAFGMSSALVAWVALTVSYRNNFGWKPLILTKELGLEWDEESREEVSWLVCSFEIWNRRKYAVVVREMEVKFGGREVVGKTGSIGAEGPGWCATSNGTLFYIGEVPLEASERKEFRAVGAHPRRLDVRTEGPKHCDIWLEFYDPRKNGQSSLHSRIRWGPRWWGKLSASWWREYRRGRRGSITFSENRTQGRKGKRS